MCFFYHENTFEVVVNIHDLECVKGQMLLISAESWANTPELGKGSVHHQYTLLLRLYRTDGSHQAVMLERYPP